MSELTKKQYKKQLKEAKKRAKSAVESGSMTEQEALGRLKQFQETANPRRTPLTEIVDDGFTTVKERTQQRRDERAELEEELQRRKSFDFSKKALKESRKKEGIGFLSDKKSSLEQEKEDIQGRLSEIGIAQFTSPTLSGFAKTAATLRSGGERVGDILTGNTSEESFRDAVGPIDTKLFGDVTPFGGRAMLQQLDRQAAGEELTGKDKSKVLGSVVKEGVGSAAQIASVLPLGRAATGTATAGSKIIGNIVGKVGLSAAATRSITNVLQRILPGAIEGAGGNLLDSVGFDLGEGDVSLQQGVANAKNAAIIGAAFGIALPAAGLFMDGVVSRVNKYGRDLTPDEVGQVLDNVKKDGADKTSIADDVVHGNKDTSVAIKELSAEASAKYDETIKGIEKDIDDFLVEGVQKNQQQLNDLVESIKAKNAEIDENALRRKIATEIQIEKTKAQLEVRKEKFNETVKKQTREVDAKRAELEKATTPERRIVLADEIARLETQLEDKITKDLEARLKSEKSISKKQGSIDEILGTAERKKLANNEKLTKEQKLVKRKNEVLADKASADGLARKLAAEAQLARETGDVERFNKQIKKLAKVHESGEKMLQEIDDIELKQGIIRPQTTKPDIASIEKAAEFAQREARGYETALEVKAKRFTKDIKKLSTEEIEDLYEKRQAGNTSGMSEKQLKVNNWITEMYKYANDAEVYLGIDDVEYKQQTYIKTDLVDIETGAPATKQQLDDLNEAMKKAGLSSSERKLNLGTSGTDSTLNKKYKSYKDRDAAIKESGLRTNLDIEGVVKEDLSRRLRKIQKEALAQAFRDVALSEGNDEITWVFSREALSNARNRVRGRLSVEVKNIKDSIRQIKTESKNTDKILKSFDGAEYVDVSDDALINRAIKSGSGFPDDTVDFKQSFSKYIAEARKNLGDASEELLSEFDDLTQSLKNRADQAIDHLYDDINAGIREAEKKNMVHLGSPTRPGKMTGLFGDKRTFNAVSQMFDTPGWAAAKVGNVTQFLIKLLEPIKRWKFGGELFRFATNVFANISHAVSTIPSKRPLGHFKQYNRLARMSERVYDDTLADAGKYFTTSVSSISDNSSRAVALTKDIADNVNKAKALLDAGDNLIQATPIVREVVNGVEDGLRLLDVLQYDVINNNSKLAIWLDEVDRLVADGYSVTDAKVAAGEYVDSISLQADPTKFLARFPVIFSKTVSDVLKILQLSGNEALSILGTGVNDLTHVLSFKKLGSTRGLRGRIARKRILSTIVAHQLVTQSISWAIHHNDPDRKNWTTFGNDDPGRWYLVQMKNGRYFNPAGRIGDKVLSVLNDPLDTFANGASPLVNVIGLASGKFDTYGKTRAGAIADQLLPFSLFGEELLETFIPGLQDKHTPTTVGGKALNVSGAFTGVTTRGDTGDRMNLGKFIAKVSDDEIQATINDFADIALGGDGEDVNKSIKRRAGIDGNLNDYATQEQISKMKPEKLQAFYDVYGNKDEVNKIKKWQIAIKYKDVELTKAEYESALRIDGVLEPEDKLYTSTYSAYLRHREKILLSENEKEAVRRFKEGVRTNQFTRQEGLERLEAFRAQNITEAEKEVVGAVQRLTTMAEGGIIAEGDAQYYIDLLEEGEISVKDVNKEMLKILDN